MLRIPAAVRIAAVATLLAVGALGCRSQGTPTPTRYQPSISRDATTPPSGGTVYITDTGKKYHEAGCRTLSKSRTAISLSEAQAQGYTPCAICIPGGGSVTSSGPTVYVTKSGKKYHTASCSSLSESREALPLATARSQGYTPCDRCSPPTR